MVKNLIVVGELHQDLNYESNFYEQLVNKIVEKLINFIKYNPDDLMNRRLLEKLVKGAFSDTPKKITVFSIETQEVKTLEVLSQLIKKKYDLIFLNLKDAKSILDKNVTAEEVDEKFSKFAKIRVYNAGKDGSNIITDNFKLFLPGMEVDAIMDRTRAGDCYAAGFLTRIYNLIEDKSELNELLKEENSEKLKEILKGVMK